MLAALQQDQAPSEPPLEQPRPPAHAGELFGGFLQQAAITRRDVRRRRLMCGLSVGFHGLLLLIPLLVATKDPRVPAPPRVSVTMLRYSPGPPPAARSAAPTPAATVKPRPAKPVVVRAPAVVQPAESPPPVEPDVEPAGQAQADDGEPGGVKGGVAGTVASPGVDMPAAAPAISAAQVRALLERYLQEILRGRIKDGMAYPPEAERIGAEGTVLVRVRVDGAGKLVSAALAGACPHEILCEAALQTVRASSPFPAPPRELGATIEMTVPLTYRLE